MTLRMGIAAAILLPIYLIRKHPPFIPTICDTWPAILGITLNMLFFIIGVSMTTANAAAVIYTVTPLITLFLAKARIQEYSSPRKLFGIILGLVGVAGIILLPVLKGEHALDGDPMGNLLILCGVFSWSYYIVNSRQMIAQKHYDPLTVATMGIVGAFVIFAFLTLITPHRPFVTAALSGAHPWLLLGYGIGVTAATFLLHQWAIKHSSATTGSLTNYLQPVFAFVYNGIFIGEELSVEFFTGSILVLIGTFLATSEQISSYMRRIR